jgi:hypothetical protein
MSDFVVRIDSTKLNAKQSASLAAAIQGAVLAELGNVDLTDGHTEHASGAAAAPGGVGVGSILFHPEWRGIWIRNLRDLQGPQMPALIVQTKQL